MKRKQSIDWTDAKWRWRAKIAAKRIGVTLDAYIAHLMIGEKWCSRCRVWHSRFIFQKDASRADGLAASCRPMPKQKLILSKDERRDQANETYRRYYAGRGGAAIRASKYARKRRIAPISPLVRELVMEGFDGLCAYCQRPATTIDHVVPVIRGGGSKRGNLLPACVSCNSRKNTLSFDEFIVLAANPHDRINDELVMEYVL